MLKPFVFYVLQAMAPRRAAPGQQPLVPVPPTVTTAFQANINLSLDTAVAAQGLSLSEAPSQRAVRLLTSLGGRAVDPPPLLVVWQNCRKVTKTLQPIVLRLTNCWLVEDPTPATLAAASLEIREALQPHRALLDELDPEDRLQYISFLVTLHLLPQPLQEEHKTRLKKRLDAALRGASTTLPTGPGIDEAGL